ncbi:MAG: hypothetical protein DMD33_08720 [Gemmatimonadetes bacterium]|nr:MAG: hypothetical protein DMD33_08720 [Gemmatimonadota bacterium]PYO73870.1 MAG: hypothetical protein DMD67_14765 [Gemmatimonadota bacterium]TLY49362.1 MAG: hypothetical protein E6K55_13080 [Gemmatimonadota bacterium]
MTIGMNPPPQPLLDRSSQFRQCLRQRLRLAREIAALRARFATAVHDYERVLRTLQLLAPTVGLSEQDVVHPTDPEWGPAALLTYADGYFLKGEQDRIDRLLHLMP